MGCVKGYVERSAAGGVVEAIFEILSSVEVLAGADGGAGDELPTPSSALLLVRTLNWARDLALSQVTPVSCR